MLYIGSAQTPTPILHSCLVPDLTNPGSSSLVLAKPDRVEVWDTSKTGLVFNTELEVWGSVVGLDKVITRDAKPHILVLISPPNAQLLVLTYESTSSLLAVTASVPLTPPTPALRLAEYFTGVIVHENVALVSLWVGILSCIELEVEKDKDTKRRRSSAANSQLQELGDRRLRVKETFAINVREQNLLHLSFHPGTPSTSGPVVSFLSLSPQNTLLLHPRAFSLSSRAFLDLAKATDVVSPLDPSLDIDEETDFNEVPFSCPAARRVLPVSTDGTEKFALVMGDEHSVLYSIAYAPSSPRTARMSISSNTATSPRASAARRSPQAEMTNIGKRRKSSIGGKSDSGDKWEVKPVWRIRQGFGTVLTASVIESRQNGANVLIGDDAGRLTAVVWEFSDNSSKSVHVRQVDMGLSSPASSLTYLGSSTLFLSSPCGDALLVKLNVPGGSSSPLLSGKTAPRPIAGRKGKGRARELGGGAWDVDLEDDAAGSVDVIERWMNLAPIKDFCVVAEEGGGMSHLVVASGASNTNSLRIVRSGAGLEEIIHVDGLEGVERMWSLPTKSASHLLLSTSMFTSLLRFAPEVTEVDMPPDLALPTIAAGQVRDTQRTIQVTSDSVVTWRMDGDDRQIGAYHRWRAPTEIIAAHVHNEMAVAAMQSGQLAILIVSEEAVEPVITCAIPAEIASVTIYTSSNIPSPVVAIGTWSNEILLYTLDHLQNGASTVTTIPETHFASSLLLKPRLSADPSSLQLLAGLSDGSLVVYDVDQSDSAGGLAVTNRKASSLGTRPLSLQAISGHTPNGEEQLVAIGLTERTSIVFETHDRIDTSSISRKDVTAATSINLDGERLVLASPSGLSFVKVNNLKKLHVQTMDLGNRSANKVVSLTDSKLLALGATTRTTDIDTGDVFQTGHFELRDPSSLQLVAEETLQEREEVTCVADVLLLGRRYVAVGTAIFPAMEEDVGAAFDEIANMAKEGRLLLVEPRMVDGTCTIRIATSLKTVGAVRDVATIHGFLAVAAASQVSIYRLDADGLKEASSFANTFVASRLWTAPIDKLHPEERLVIGDGLRSVIVLEVDEGSGAICNDQKDMPSHRVMALQGIKDGGQGVIIADGFSNLRTFRLNEHIEAAATFGMHEDVVAFQPGSFAPASSAPEVMLPDLIFATSEGRLGILGELAPSAARLLDDLQRNMDKYVKGPGGISWKEYRRGGTQLDQRNSAGFIDGDFVKKFWDPELVTQVESDKIVKGGSVHEHISRLNLEGKKETADKADVVRVLEAAAGLH